VAGFVPPPGFAPPTYDPPGYSSPVERPAGFGAHASSYGPPPAYGYSPVETPAKSAYDGWVSSAPSAVQPGPEPGLAWAGIGVRVGALVLDSVFFFIFFLAVGVVMDMPGLATVDGTIQYQWLSTAIGLSAWAIGLFYVPVCWYLFGGTAGQRLLSLRVVRASNGAKVGIGRILLRYLVWAICLSFFIPAIIAGVLASGDRQKRAWTDIAGESVVVREV
jgi:uncharacterized RDD family membrane protein YckC